MNRRLDLLSTDGTHMPPEMVVMDSHSGKEIAHLPTAVWTGFTSIASATSSRPRWMATRRRSRRQSARLIVASSSYWYHDRYHGNRRLALSDWKIGGPGRDRTDDLFHAISLNEL